MELEPDFVKQTIDDFFALCAQHRLIGISAKDAVEGKPIPPGYWFHYGTQYYLPPNYKQDESTLNG